MSESHHKDFFLEKQKFCDTCNPATRRPTSGIFHFRRAAFSAQLKAKVGSTLVKAASLRINLILMGHLSLQKHTLTHHTLKHLVH
jgi:hypothetical protein